VVGAAFSAGDNIKIGRATHLIYLEATRFTTFSLQARMLQDQEVHHHGFRAWEETKTPETSR